MENQNKEGFLIIGNPCISSRRPERRLDVDYLSVVSKKLLEAMRIAEDGRLVPVILGDVLEKGKDDKALIELIKVLVGRGAYILPETVDWNKKRAGAYLSLIHESRTAQVIDAYGVVTRIVDSKGRGTVLVAVPSGESLPMNCESFRTDPSDRIVLISHAEVREEGQDESVGYEPFEIKGVEHVFYGLESIGCSRRDAGITRWIGAGRIVRKYIAEREMTPCFWRVDGEGRAEKLDVKVKRSVFDLTGIGSGAGAVTQEQKSSLFVDLFKAQEVEQGEGEKEVSEELGEINQVLLEMKATDEVAFIVRDLFEEVSDIGKGVA